MEKSDKNKMGVFTDAEREAMRTRAKELAAESRSKKKKEDNEKDALEAINKLREPDRAMAMKIHEIIKANAPMLWAKTWYGMPAYANGDKIICFFQTSDKFKTRYSTLGFNDSAHLDEGDIWPVAYALMKLTPTVEKKIIELIKQAVK